MEIYVVDTETTGLEGHPVDVILEIAICKVNTETKTVEKVYDLIVGHDITDWEYHRRHAWIFGNSNLKLSMIPSGKSEKEVIKEVREILKDKYVTSYNTSYDFAHFLSLEPWSLDNVVKDIISCIMISSTPVCGIEGYYDEYKWPRLEEAYDMLVEGNPAKIEGQDHRALSDTLMASHVLLSLFESNNYSLPEEERA